MCTQIANMVNFKENNCIILFKLDFDVKFPLLRLLLFLSDLKSTISSLIKKGRN